MINRAVVERQSAIKPMSNLTYRLMECALYVWDIFLRHPYADLKKLALRPGMTIVDYGCGPGHYTIPVAEAVGPDGMVYAVDVQPLAMQTITREAARRSLRNVKTVLVDSYATGMAASSADIVLLIDVFHYITDREALFQEIHRLLKSDGVLYMDPGHMKVGQVKDVVENIGLFDLAGFDGRNMQFKKRASSA